MNKVRGKTGEGRERVMAFMRERLLHEACPTLREVQEALGIDSTRTVFDHLEALVADGELEKLPQRARGYRLPGAPPSAVLVPLLGRVQAGALTTATEDLEGYVSVDASTRGKREELFALRVRGESMRDAGILPGDIVIVTKRATADSGDIVVALVNDEATVKRLWRGKKRIELRPENAHFAPIVVDEGSLHLLGKVIEVRRHLQDARRPK